MKEMFSSRHKNQLFNSVKNLIGTFVYFFCQWLVLIIVIHIAGYTVSGEFSLIISFTNLFGLVSRYNLRNFQLSDVECRFTQQQYTGAYIMTSGIAIVCFFITLPFTGFNNNLLLCCIVYLLYKLCETLSMYIFTYMQQADCFSNILISFCLKGLIPLLVFSVCLYLKQNLFISICAMALAYLSLIFLYDFNIIKDIFPKGIIIKGTKFILKHCFPLMLSLLVLPFMLFFTRYTVENIYGTTELGYYSAMTMVIAVFSTLANSVFVVILPVISEKYMKKQKRDIIRIIFTILGVIFAIAFAAILLVRLIGNMVFSFIFGVTILPYMYLLLPAIITSTLLIIMAFFSNCLIAMHKRISMLISMLTGVIFLSSLIIPVTKSYGILGNIILFSLSIGIIIVIQLIVISSNLHKFI